MKTLLGAAAVAAFVAASGMAMAQSSTSPSATSPSATSPGATTGSTAGASMQTATGTVSKVDRSGNAVTLSDGNSYKLSSSADLSKVKEGDQVRIQYRTQGSDRMASDITSMSGTAGSTGSTSGSSSMGGTSGSSSSDTTGTTKKQ
ncbi:DUF1344 domain-containing protein [Azospirillum sp.]|uniref:DUF1344 domain-containing protein n=1 Tax=Azospirillum sp. TaxID=34012 RepID=UPI002D4699C6|nr:DUF1344 domain-containing protein [Azospirillum sp.]HYD68156.1 DUF1344 domain-containing protein [Azospirillum sp.]